MKKLFHIVELCVLQTEDLWIKKWFDQCFCKTLYEKRPVSEKCSTIRFVYEAMSEKSRHQKKVHCRNSGR